MGHLTVLHVGLGAKIGDLHAKDSHSFCNRLIAFNVPGCFGKVCTDPRLEVCHLVHKDRARGGTDFYILILIGGKMGCFLSLSSLHVILTLLEDWNQTTAKYASNPHLMGSPNYYLRFHF